MDGSGVTRTRHRIREAQQHMRRGQITRLQIQIMERNRRMDNKILPSEMHCHGRVQRSMIGWGIEGYRTEIQKSFYFATCMREGATRGHPRVASRGPAGVLHVFSVHMRPSPYRSCVEDQGMATAKPMTKKKAGHTRSHSASPAPSAQSLPGGGPPAPSTTRTDKARSNSARRSTSSKSDDQTVAKLRRLGNNSRAGSQGEDKHKSAKHEKRAAAVGKLASRADLDRLATKVSANEERWRALANKVDLATAETTIEATKTTGSEAKRLVEARSSAEEAGGFTVQRGGGSTAVVFDDPDEFAQLVKDFANRLTVFPVLIRRLRILTGQGSRLAQQFVDLRAFVAYNETTFTFADETYHIIFEFLACLALMKDPASTIPFGVYLIALATRERCWKANKSSVVEKWSEPSHATWCPTLYAANHTVAVSEVPLPSEYGQHDIFGYSVTAFAQFNGRTRDKPHCATCSLFHDKGACRVKFAKD